MAAASRVLHVDKATVSRRLAELERSAPAPLFERRAGQIQLTPYGARAIDAYRDYEHSRRRLEAQLECADDDTKASVRVTMPGFFACEVVGPALRGFLETYPNLDVQLVSSNRILDVARGEADIALRNIRPRGGNLNLRRIGRLTMATFASHEYRSRYGELRAPRCLSGHQYISYDSGPYAGPGFEWMNEAIQHARVAFSANDAMLLRAAAISGLGMVTLPAFMGDETPELARVAGAGEGMTDLWLVTAPEQRRVRRVRAVHEFLTDLVQRQQARLCPSSPFEPEPVGSRVVSTVQ
jgi:DNA-binding transcriptional LysR family regulator